MGIEFTVIAIAVALLWFGVRRWFRLRGTEWARLPGELRRAELVYSERLFRADEPEAISAKVDRVY